ncbi:MAG: hypothetical protein ABL891_18310, partial [Burkholderiales bacterium]
MNYYLRCYIVGFMADARLIQDISSKRCPRSGVPEMVVRAKWFCAFLASRVARSFAFPEESVMSMA